MRIVFDTNIFLSMLIWRNRQLEPLYELFCQKTIVVCIIPEIIDELKIVLNYPKFTNRLIQSGLTPDAIIKIISNNCLIFPSPSEIPTVIKEDISDNLLLACALESGAHFIISGDKHLLQLKEFQGISILTPKQFLKKIKK